MNFSKELHKVGLLHDCNTCVISNCSRRGKPCNTYYPADMDDFIDDIMYDMSATVNKTEDKRLTRHIASDRHQTTHDGDTLDKYYVGFINDSLKQIRKHGVAYVFHLSHIKELLRFEDLNVKYNADADCFEVSMA